MTDKELLELAALAARVDYAEYLPDDDRSVEEQFDAIIKSLWNPLTDDGDALRLAVKLQLNFNWEDFNTLDVWCPDTHKNATEEFTDDPYAATRRAIVRVAAEIGRGMK